MSDWTCLGGLCAVGAVYYRVITVVAWLPVGIISMSRPSHRGRGKGNAQDKGKGDSHGEPPIAPRHKTVVKVSLGPCRSPNKGVAAKTLLR